MKTIRLAAIMLRYRVASLLLPFFLLAPALHQQLTSFRWTYVAGLIALCGSYVVATCLNDVFDFEIDRINHPHAVDRPLVSGAATPKQLIAIAIGTAIVALACGLLIGPFSIALVTASLLLNVAYSVPPIRLCARPLAAPLVLAFAYVALPYGIGLAAVSVTPDWFDVRVVVCFMVLFTGRMLLKDFRDRRGDAAFDKRTFLLTYGKPATLTVVGACILAGDVLLLTVMPTNPVLIIPVETYFAAIGFQLARLWSADTFEDERTAIALGARMGNAVVLTLLGYVMLRSAGVDGTSQATFVIAMAAMFWFTFGYLMTRPQEAVGAYRG